MNKKTIGLGMASLSLGAMLLVPTADAFFGRGGEQERTPEMFAEMQQMVQSANSWEDLEAAREATREARQSLVFHEVEKIDNGVIVTITTDDADALARMRERQENGQNGNGQGLNRENVSRSIETLANGARITITTDDADTLERLHARADEGWKMGRGHGRGGRGMKGQGMGQGQDGSFKRGQGRGQRGGNQM